MTPPSKANPKISVIIPVYNGARYLGETIQSVLDQTYPHFELILVDDASPDNSAEIIHGFDDPRVFYLRHETNKGSNGSRNTGVRASSGKLIAFLDQDDYFHPDKLQSHVNYFREHPGVGLAYNSRFELHYGSTAIRDLWRPPHNLSLFDVVQGFPIAPSDMVIDRNWLFRVGLLDESVHFFGAEIVLLGHLALAGCHFGHVDRALNYRWRHPGRTYRHIEAAFESELACQRKIFTDPRCPPDVVVHQNVAYANTCLDWGYRALDQEETKLGQRLIRQAIRLNPTIVQGHPCRLLTHMVYHSVQDDNRDHTATLTRILHQLPEEATFLRNHHHWALAEGFLIQGVRAAIWGPHPAAKEAFSQAASYGAQYDGRFFQNVTNQLLAYEQEMGLEATEAALHRLEPYLNHIGGQTATRRLRGCLNVNRGFRDYRLHRYDRIPGHLVQAVLNDPSYMTNRGVWSVLVHALINRPQTTAQHGI